MNITNITSEAVKYFLLEKNELLLYQIYINYLSNDKMYNYKRLY